MSLSAAVVPGALARVPVDLGRDAARGAARSELAKPEYAIDRPGLVQRGLDWVLDKLLGLLHTAGSATPFGWAGLATLGALLLLAIVAVRLRLGPWATARRSGTAPLLSGRPRSAAEHRARAEAHARAGEWDDAVRERLRAIVRGLQERGLVDSPAGWTAHEAAAEGGRAVPEAADALHRAADLFDGVHYGGRHAGPAQEQELRDLDARLAARRPSLPVAPR